MKKTIMTNNVELNNEIMKEQTNEMGLENSSNQIPSTIQDGNLEIKVPSKKWLDDYMKNNIQYGLITRIEFSLDKILGDFEEEIQEMWIDCDYRLNFPYQSLNGILEYYGNEYLDELDSCLIFKLKRYLKEERTKIINVINDWSKDEIEFEEFITR